MALEASIDIDSPENSIYQILNTKFKDICDFNSESNVEYSSTSSIIVNKKAVDYHETWTMIEKAINANKSSLNSGLNESNIIREIGKCDLSGSIEESNFRYISIINILKNESFGCVYMFLSKPSPLSLRVKSKCAELFLLRKYDVFSISKQYSNILNRYYK